jgi:arsenate reductase
MSKYTIFHNPRCSKSRQTLQILKDNECDTEIILYLETALDQSVLDDVIKKISLSPRELLRKGEQEFKDNDLKNKNFSDQEIIAFMVKHPKLIERPIVIKDDKAILGRPPENVLELI